MIRDGYCSNWPVAVRAVEESGGFRKDEMNDIAVCYCYMGNVKR